MKRILLVLMAVALGFSIGFAGKAGAVPVPVAWTGPGSFTSATQTISPSFLADSILSITGSGIFHGHEGADVTGTIEVRLNGIFTPVASIPSALGVSILLSSLTFPISFPAGEVSGIGFSGAPLEGVPEYHSFAGEVITFNTPAEPPPPNGVPEPATLLFLGSGLLGLIAFRARFK